MIRVWRVAEILECDMTGSCDVIRIWVIIMTVLWLGCIWEYDVYNYKLFPDNWGWELIESEWVSEYVIGNVFESDVMG